MKRCRLPSRRQIFLSIFSMLILFLLIHGLLLVSSGSFAPRFSRHSGDSLVKKDLLNHPKNLLKAKFSAAALTTAAVEEKSPISENEHRRLFVREMMLHAWYGYRNNTWGANEVRPISKLPNNQPIFGGDKMAATIVDAADSLWIMGLQEEYKQARNFIEEEFSISKATGMLSVFETFIRFVGGLLALHALSKETFYLEKAREVADALLPAFSTPTGIPKSNMDMKSGYSNNYGWANGGASILSEIGSVHLELVYLSHHTQQPIFARKAQRVRDALDKVEKVQGGLYSNYISPNTGKWQGGTHVSLGALGDSFYEYLLKSWLLTGRRDEQARRMYWDASEAIQNKLRLIEELGKTCHESYIRSESRIGPEMFYFDEREDATSRRGENGYILRPEVIEGFFYLWRITHNPMYKEWVWDAITAINKHCRREGGFAGLQNVYDPEKLWEYRVSLLKGNDDVQQSFFLAETLKYAYLTFAPDSLLSLDEWVFNTEAHPLPILESFHKPRSAEIPPITENKD